MNSIGGDAFWLIHIPGETPRAIDACGAAGARATPAFYRELGFDAIPFRGGVAANTVAGTLSGWALALECSKDALGGRLPLSRLLADAIHYARHGIPVTHSQHATTTAKLDGLRGQPGFDETFLAAGDVPAVGAPFLQPRLAATFQQLASAGLGDFYHGDLARSIVRDLAAAGSPLTSGDLSSHRAGWRKPLALAHSLGSAYNLPPPTQGVVSLLILGILDTLDIGATDPMGADYIHLCVEAAKQAFGVRDRHVTDPAYMTLDAQDLLSTGSIESLATRIDPRRAAPWGAGRGPADTIWMGVIDGAGRAVSFIQSLYHEYGAGIVLRESGINWQNRGCSFSLDARAQSFVPGPQAVPHIESGAGAASRRHDDGLRQHGRRWAAADAKRGIHALCRLRHESAGGGRGAAVAPRAHLGRDERHAEAGIALRRCRHRGFAGTRTRRGAAWPVRRGRRPCGRCPARCERRAARRQRSALRRRSSGVVARRVGAHPMPAHPIALASAHFAGIDNAATENAELSSACDRNRMFRQEGPSRPTDWPPWPRAERVGMFFDRLIVSGELS
jgi:gamma-glutamyltranspeptidase/glutathione hydrolase